MCSGILVDVLVLREVATAARHLCTEIRAERRFQSRRIDFAEEHFTLRIEVGAFEQPPYRIGQRDEPVVAKLADVAFEETAPHQSRREQIVVAIPEFAYCRRQCRRDLSVDGYRVTGYGAEQYRGVRRRKLPQRRQFQLDQRTLRGVDVNRDDSVGLGEQQSRHIVPRTADDQHIRTRGRVRMRARGGSDPPRPANIAPGRVRRIE